jgi:hypothetical protein
MSFEAGSIIRQTERRNAATGMLESVEYDWLPYEWARPAADRAIGLIPARLYWRLFKHAPNVGDVFSLGHLNLRVVDISPDDFCRDTATVMRDGPEAALTAWLLPALRFTDLVYRRLIITAAIWRLATCDRAVIPSWRDLHAARWLLRKLPQEKKAWR